MKKFIAVISSALAGLTALSVSVFAAEPYAYFEGDDQTPSGFLDKLLAGLDAKMLMGNWYKIIIGMVIAACVIGILVTNIRGLVRFIKKKKAAKAENKA